MGTVLVTPGDEVVDPWVGVVGQPALVETLRASVATPVHAYMLVGRTGSGTRALAQAMAAEILAGGSVATDPIAVDRARRLALDEQHPAQRVVERSGASISRDEVREVVAQASQTPPEGDRQVLVLVDFHLVGDSAPVLLKALEEPPEGTYFIVLAEDVPPELVTISSRCSTFEVPPIPNEVIVATLQNEGTSPDLAEIAATAAGGDLDRARLLVTDPELRARRDYWYGVPDRLDGTGATSVETADGAIALVDALLEPLVARHDAERAAVETELEELGGPRGVLKQLEARHKREQRRIRTDELVAGLAALQSRYRQACLDGRPDAAGEYEWAATAAAEVADAITFNANERLALIRFFSDLSPR